MEVPIRFTYDEGDRKAILEDFNNGTSIKDLCIIYNVSVFVIKRIIDRQYMMNESEKRKQLTPQERKALGVTWAGVKSRHQGIDIRSEWDKYIVWLKGKNIPEPKPSIKSILAFEKQWINSINVTRINNPSSFKEKEKEIPLTDIQKVYDLLSKRRLQITEDEIRTLLMKGVSVVAIELWFQNAILPNNPAFRIFLASKGKY